MDPKLAQALEGLRDIHLPQPVGWWPLAPACWALAAALLVATLGSVLLVRWRRRRRESLRALALAELAKLEQRADASPETLAIALTALLRRVALGRARQAGAALEASSSEVASLHGERWIAYLTEGRKDPACNSRVARELVHSAYAGECAAQTGDPREWIDFTRAWIREVAA